MSCIQPDSTTVALAIKDPCPGMTFSRPTPRFVLREKRAVWAKYEMIALQRVADLAVVRQVALVCRVRVAVLEPRGCRLDPGHRYHVQRADVFQQRWPAFLRVFLVLVVDESRHPKRSYGDHR